MSGIFSSGVSPATNQQDYVQTKQLMRQRGGLGILMTFLDAPSLQFGACVKPGFHLTSALISCLAFILYIYAVTLVLYSGSV